MEHYIMPKAAGRKLKAARSLRQVAYIYAATGYGKTAFIREFFAKHRYVYRSAGDRKWDESTRPPQAPQRESPKVLVIDDLQLLDEARRGLVKDLVRRADLWVVLVSRSPVPAWLMPEYVNVGFMVISEDDMRLTGEDIAGYLTGLGLRYTEEGLQYLADTAEGNAYIVRHCAQRMAEGLMPGPQMYKEVHDAFARYLENYIMGEWDSDLLEFLMQVSVVEEFTLPLAELITANRLAFAMVEKALETGNFLSEREGVYRLRPVLLHALRERALRVLGEEQVKACAKNAGVFYEMNGQAALALHMYQFSGSTGQIRELLVRNARMNPGAGHYYELKDYYLQMDEGEVEKSPVLMAGLSMLHSMLMDPEKSEYWYKKLEGFAKNATGGARREAQSRLCYLDIGLPHRGSRDVLKVMLRAPAMLLDRGISLPEFSVTSNLPSTMNGGKDFCSWSRADRALAKTAGPAVERVLGRYGKGLVKAALGESLFEKGGDPYEVLTLLSRAQVESECGGVPEITFAAVGQRVRLAVLQGDLSSANALLDSFREAAKERKAPQLMPNIEAMACRLALYGGDSRAARQWLCGAPDEDKEFITMERYRYLTKVLCYLCLGEDLKALALLEKLCEYAARFQRTYIAMEAGLLDAVVRRRLGAQWEGPLEAALDEAERYRFVRVISQMGAAILPLLKGRGREGPWFSQVLEEARLMAKQYPRYLQPSNTARGAFSRTAREVLRLQAEGLTATLIAEELGMKPDTVRYHIKENYRKLGVGSKAEAIAAAKGLGLL